MFNESDSIFNIVPFLLKAIYVISSAEFSRFIEVYDPTVVDNEFIFSPLSLMNLTSGDTVILIFL